MRNTQEHTEPIQEERSQKSKHLGLLRGTGVHSFFGSALPTISEHRFQPCNDRGATGYLYFRCRVWTRWRRAGVAPRDTILKRPPGVRGQ